MHTVDGNMFNIGAGSGRHHHHAATNIRVAVQDYQSMDIEALNTAMDSYTQSNAHMQTPAQKKTTLIWQCVSTCSVIDTSRLLTHIVPMRTRLHFIQGYLMPQV
jgi:hypothetical protein